MVKPARKGKPRPAAPIPSSQRLRSLDALRGFAVLGILAVNIQSFSMIEAAYLNPTAYGTLRGADAWCWLLLHVLADRKHLPIFAALFAAGILLMERRAGGRSVAAFHYRRMFWLGAIGLLHAGLLWDGDILVSLSLAGALVFPLRRMVPARLVATGLLALLAASLLVLLIGWTVPRWSPEATREQEQMWRPDAERVEQEIALHSSPWRDQVTQRLTAIDRASIIFLFWSSWQNGAIMLIGMALFEWGFLSGKRTARCYRAVLATAAAVGLPVVVGGALLNFRAGWRMDFSMFSGSQLNYWGSLLVALAYTAGILLIDRARRLDRAVERLAEVGRLALTNYLLQSLICTAIFSGWGLGLFGRLDRTQQILVILGVWAVNLGFTRVWLRSFQFGPVEWLLRVLTYRRLLPMRRATPRRPGSARSS